MRLPILVINRFSAYFSKAYLATNDTNEHELKGNMQKATWGYYIFIFGSGYAGLGYGFDFPLRSLRLCERCF